MSRGLFTEKRVVFGKEETIALAERLHELAKAGEVEFFAARIFKADGTWEDVAVGGTDEDKAEALAELRKMYSDAH